MEVVNPHHEVPAMKHKLDGEDFYLSESHAIMQYLCELQGEKVWKHYFGHDIAERSLITQYLSWNHMALKHNLIRGHVLKSFIRPYILGTAVLKRPTENEISKWRSGCMEPLMHLDNRLKDKQFLVGNRLTAADVAVSTTISQILVDPDYASILANFPNVVNWLRHLAERDAWKVAHFAVTDASVEIRKHYECKSSVPGDFSWAEAWEKMFDAHIIREVRPSEGGSDEPVVADGGGSDEAASPAPQEVAKSSRFETPDIDDMII